MRLLLDTHVVIWLATEPAKLSATVIDALGEAEETYVSFASAWEYVIKHAKGRPDFATPFAAIFSGLPAVLLGAEFDVVHSIAALPPIHRDPFDRLLVAQALHHRMTLVSNDADIRKYPVPTLW